MNGFDQIALNVENRKSPQFSPPCEGGVTGDGPCTTYSTFADFVPIEIAPSIMNCKSPHISPSCEGGVGGGGPEGFGLENGFAVRLRRRAWPESAASSPQPSPCRGDRDDLSLTASSAHRIQRYSPSPRWGEGARRAGEGASQCVRRNRRGSAVCQRSLNSGFVSPVPDGHFTGKGSWRARRRLFPFARQGCPAHPPWPPLHKGGKVGLHAGLFSFCTPGPPDPPPLAPPSQGGEGWDALRADHLRARAARPTPPGPPFTRGGKLACGQSRSGGCR
jgi:hypothetical protein